MCYLLQTTYQTRKVLWINKLKNKLIDFLVQSQPVWLKEPHAGLQVLRQQKYDPTAFLWKLNILCSYGKHEVICSYLVDYFKLLTGLLEEFTLYIIWQKNKLIVMDFFKVQDKEPTRFSGHLRRLNESFWPQLRENPLPVAGASDSLALFYSCVNPQASSNQL